MTNVLATHSEISAAGTAVQASRFKQPLSGHSRVNLLTTEAQPVLGKIESRFDLNRDFSVLAVPFENQAI